MIMEYEEDAHFCIKCHVTILGLENYINHRKVGCSKNLTEAPKSPLPSQLLHPDESFNLKADDFFSSLELRSSSKKSDSQSTSGKTFSGILTRSKTTAVIQASSSNVKEQQEPQQSKSGKNVWIGGHQLKELGHGDNQSKLIKAVDNLERRKEEPQKLEVFEDSDEDSEEYDYDVDDSSSDDQDGPPRNHTGGKWKPSSPIQWSRNNEARDWNYPPPSFTGGKWKPKRSTPPPVNHTKGKWKPSFSQKEDYSIPPPTFTGSKWVSKKTEDLDVPPPNFTGSKWVASKRQDPEIPPPTHTKGKWKPRGDEEQFTTGGKGKWKPADTIEDDIPPVNYTKGKWKPRCDLEGDYPPPTHTKGKWKPRNDDELPSTSYTKEKQRTPVEMQIQASPKSMAIEQAQDAPEENYTKGKWIPSTETQNKFTKKFTDNSLLRKSSGAVQYWCTPCNRRLASKLVYERHLKSELHFKRTSRDGEFDETDELALIKEARRTKLKPPEDIFSSQEQIQTKKSKQRIKKNQKCEVQPSNKEDITSDVAKAVMLGNIRDVVLESPYQCSPCKFYCNTLKDLLRHWLSPEHKGNSSPGYFHCNICKHRAEDTETMYQHLISPQHAEMAVINRAIPIVIKKYNPAKCPTCNEEFLLNMQLLNHCKQFQHDDTEVKKFKNEYICDICGEGLLSNMSLRRHKHMVHKQKYFICTPCNLKFDDINEAKLHRKSQQHKYTSLEKQNVSNLKKKCQYCGACFGNFLLLKQHLQSDHPEHNVRCPHCGASFTITQELTTHLRLKQCKFEEHPETTENTLQCEKCPFSSNSISELFFHIALHEEPLVNYQNHTESSLVKAVLKYRCPVCENFYPKASLQGHIRQHTQDRPFVCSICSKSFARKNNLQFHIKNHEKKEERVKLKQTTSETAFLCCTCGANFKKKYLASGCTFTDIHYSYRLGISAISNIVRRVCRCIWSVLQVECISKPTKENWEMIASIFENRANFPHCIGAVDGKHIRIINPLGSMYFNYKGYSSIVLMAVADSDYRFTYVDIGSYGKDCDSNIFKESSLWTSIIKGHIQLPEEKCLRGATNPKVPYFLVGDEAFALHKHLLRPYGGHNLTVKKRVFNYRLSRARRYIDCTFGILSNKWRIFHRPINLDPDFAVDIVKACVVLHNFVRTRDGFEVEDALTITGLLGLSGGGTVRGGLSANNVRNIVADYFLTDTGSVKWQLSKI